MLRRSCWTEWNGCPPPLQVLQCVSPISRECALSSLCPVPCIHRSYMGITHGQALRVADVFYKALQTASPCPERYLFPVCISPAHEKARERLRTSNHCSIQTLPCRDATVMRGSSAWQLLSRQMLRALQHVCSLYAMHPDGNYLMA